MAYLSYYNYLGSVEFDEKDHQLKGYVQGLREETLTYTGKSLEELERNFRIVVERYLQDCARKKETPKKAAAPKKAKAPAKAAAKEKSAAPKAKKA